MRWGISRAFIISRVVRARGWENGIPPGRRWAYISPGVARDLVGNVLGLLTDILDHSSGLGTYLELEGSLGRYGVEAGPSADRSKNDVGLRTLGQGDFQDAVYGIVYGYYGAHRAKAGPVVLLGYGKADTAAHHTYGRIGDPPEFDPLHTDSGIYGKIRMVEEKPQAPDISHTQGLGAAHQDYIALRFYVQMLENQGKRCNNRQSQSVVPDSWTYDPMGFHGYCVINLGVENRVHVSHDQNVPVPRLSGYDAQAVSDLVGGTVKKLKLGKTVDQELHPGRFTEGGGGNFR